MPEISIIVPVYKTEAYLPRCIDSILAQTFSVFELLLIDDGSPDNSGKICDEYAARDSRIRVFHKENGGVSSARNLGLDNARGTYIGFVDSDDYITPDMYETLYRGFHSGKDVQLSACGICFEGKTEKNPVPDDTEAHFLSGNDVLDNIFGNKHNLRINIVNKLFLKSVIGTLRFDRSYKIAEDVLFLAEYVSAVTDASCVSVPCYVRTYRQGSATLGGTDARSTAIIPLALKAVADAVLKTKDAEDIMYSWTINETISWLNRVKADKTLAKVMRRNALPLRKKGLSVKSVDLKVRILFFLGYYGRA